VCEGVVVCAKKIIVAKVAIVANIEDFQVFGVVTLRTLKL
jgi:hypothetical protein